LTATGGPPPVERSETLHERVQAAIAALAPNDLPWTWPDAEFDSMARAVFEHQFEGCAAYRHYCEGQDRSPSRVDDWRGIPAVPTEVWKTLDLCTFPKERAAASFLTSGTTVGTRGRHHLLRTDTYTASLAPWMDRFLGLRQGRRERLVVLAPSFAQDPASSLSFMLQWAVDARGDEASDFFWSERGPEIGAAAAALREAAAERVPVVILGTARALQALWEQVLRATGPGIGGGGRRGGSGGAGSGVAAARRCPILLPEGSRAMETGGFKGAAASLGRDEFYAALSAGLGLPPHAVVSEYGMTELGSQGWQPGFLMARDETARDRFEHACCVARDLGFDAADLVGIPRLFAFPPWCRVAAADSQSLELLPEGRRGLLRFWDLSNVDSILAVQTADEGVVLPEGLGVLMFGRAPSAVPRGCSLAVDEILRGIGPRGREGAP
jgi:hypothetical protein